MSPKLDINLFYDEPRLKMLAVSRFAIRFVSYVTYSLLAAMAILLSVIDIAWLRSIGWLLDLFLLDRLLHLGRPERSLVRLPRTGDVNIALYTSPQAFAILEWAWERTLALGGDFKLYLLRRLIERPEIKQGLMRMDVKPEEFLVKLDEYIQNSSAIKKDRDALWKEVGELMAAAFKQAVVSFSEFIEPKDLFAALSESSNENIAKLFKLFEIDAGDLESVLIFSRFAKQFRWLKRLPATLVGFIGRPYKIRHRVMNRAWTARPTPTLDQFSDDLTDLARLEQVGFMIGHEAEYDRLLDILARPGNPNALLVGDPGVGKSTIVAHLAYEITKDRVPPPLFDKRLVQLDIGALVAGAEEGELQQRIKKIVAEATVAGNVILYIPDIHQLSKTSGQLRLSAAEVFLPAIKSSAFSVIGATFPREYKQYIEPDSDFASAFEVIRMQEISEAEAIKFLVYSSIILEQQYRVVISFGAIKEAVRLAHAYFRQRLLPSSAEDLLKETLTDAVEKGQKIITADEVIKIAERRINIPLHRVGRTEAEQLLNLEEFIHKRLIDQDEAVKGVASALREYRSGLARKGGPIASFLFVGPTGVGKTELSKILAQIQFGSSEQMVRLDMSEYQEKGSINRLIGSPDGTMSGNLTDAIFEKPYSLILLDEFEKAHPDVLNIFLQVFDDGRLTDNMGRTVNFQNTIIIATSNAHSEFIKSQIEAGKNIREIAEELKKKLVDYFKPELLNRFSDIIVFKNLSQEDLRAIVRLQLNDLANQLRESQGIDLIFDEAAISQLAILGYDPVFGARPLRKVISDKIKSVLAEKILRNEISRGGTIKVVFANDQFNFLL